MFIIIFILAKFPQEGNLFWNSLFINIFLEKHSFSYIFYYFSVQEKN